MVIDATDWTWKISIPEISIPEISIPDSHFFWSFKKDNLPICLLVADNAVSIIYFSVNSSA